MITKQAYAKINTYLDVISKRDDGFHDILSVMRRVSLADNVRMEIFDSSETGINLSVKGDDLPCDERNLVYRAAVRFLEKFKICSKINIEIEKNIPIGAGLGGGSADAATTIAALAEHYGISDTKALLELALEIGSDVPFCLVGGSMLCEGRGEKMTPVVSKFVHLVIAIGNSRVNTAAAYKRLDELHDDFKSPKKILAEDSESRLYNIFEETADGAALALRSRLSELSCGRALMSGSGPSVFGIFDTEESAISARDSLIADGYTAYYAHTM